MHDTFEARNELEEKLLAAQEGLLPGDECLPYLIDTRVFLPVKAPLAITGFTASELERTGSGIGISINPNWPVGIDPEPGMVRQLKHN
jgi:hypothetical protein